MADPPWSFKTYSKKGWGKSAQMHYDCMSLKDIQALPVKDLAEPDCLLWLWATNPMLPQALETIKAWGFAYKTAGCWHKRSKSWVLGCKNPKSAFGTGYILRSASEPFLLATIGRPKTAKNVRSIIEAATREHSRKPDEAYAAAESLIPNATRLELFSRQARNGWDAWGNEVGKFEAVV